MVLSEITLRLWAFVILHCKFRRKLSWNVSDTLIPLTYSIPYLLLTLYLRQGIFLYSSIDTAYYFVNEGDCASNNSQYKYQVNNPCRSEISCIPPICLEHHPCNNPLCVSCFVVFFFRIHIPECVSVVFLTSDELDSLKRSCHRVVHVVIAVLAVSADAVKVINAVQINRMAWYGREQLSYTQVRFMCVRSYAKNWACLRLKRISNTTSM